MEFLSPEVREMVEGDLYGSYEMFRTVLACVPHETECPICGGVDDDGEPYEITCKYCRNGYQITWMVQELRGRISDIAQATLIFATVTPGVQVGDKRLVVSGYDKDALRAVEQDNRAYIEVDGSYWRPFSVQPSSFGQHQEWMAYLRKHTPEVIRA